MTVSGLEALGAAAMTDVGTDGATGATNAALSDGPTSITAGAGL